MRCSLVNLKSIFDVKIPHISKHDSNLIIADRLFLSKLKQFVSNKDDLNGLRYIDIIRKFSTNYSIRYESLIETWLHRFNMKCNRRPRSLQNFCQTLRQFVSQTYILTAGYLSRYETLDKLWFHHFNMETNRRLSGLQ